MNYELRILEGPQAGRRLPVETTAAVIGRSSSAQLSFPQDSFMSGNHVSVQEVQGGVLIIDLRSTNGTFLNGDRVTQVIAGVGAIVKAGNLSMKVIQAHTPITGKVLSSPIIQRPSPSGAVAPSGATTMIMTLSSRGSSSSEPPPPTVRMQAVKENHGAVLKALRETQGPLFCLLDAALDEMLPSLLAVACDDLQKSSLLDSAVSQRVGTMPYLLVLPRDSTLLPVLVDKGWGKAWASYFTSNASLEELSAHFRRFLLVQIEGKNQVYFRFYDPRVLRDFLPVANPNELMTFFGPIQEWMIEAADKNTLLASRNTTDGLSTRSIFVAD